MCKKDTPLTFREAREQQARENPEAFVRKNGFLALSGSSKNVIYLSREAEWTYSLGMIMLTKYFALGCAAYPAFFLVRSADIMFGLGLTTLSGQLAVVCVAAVIVLAPLAVLTWRCRDEIASHDPLTDSPPYKAIETKGRIRYNGTPQSLANLGPFEDAPVPVSVFPVTFSTRWPNWLLAVVFFLGICVGVVLGESLALVAGMIDPGAPMLPSMLNSHAGVGLTAVFVGAMRPVRLRISSGTLELIRFHGFLGRGLTIERFDLRACRLLVTPYGFRVYPPDSERSFAIGPLYTHRREIVSTVLRAAVSTYPPPTLSEEELLG